MTASAPRFVDAERVESQFALANRPNRQVAVSARLPTGCRDASSVVVLLAGGWYFLRGGARRRRKLRSAVGSAPN
jgi:hypothetical protein